MEAIPVVDLRLLTQAEINALSRASSSAAGDAGRRDDVVIPKIDRSVFNESAGSRKQTYSRLRLAPRKPPELSPPVASASASASPSSSSGAGRGRRRATVGLLTAPPGSAASTSAAPPPRTQLDTEAVDDPGRRENEQIILFLRRLFVKNGIEIADKAGAHNESLSLAAVTSAGVSANPNLVGGALGNRERKQDAAEAVGKDREVLNVYGLAVDLVGLGEAEDPFGPELRRRTQGLVTEEDFLRFLNGLEGQWGSRRKRRRIVDADKFGDALPKGWKVLLALKRKEGNIWIHCRRYISPSGKQFISCKEVSAYLLSFTGCHKLRQQNAAQSSADKLGNGDKVVGHGHQVNLTSRSSSCYTAMPISAFSPDSGKQIVVYGVENPAKSQLQDILKCQECNLTFTDKAAQMQHSMTLHRSSRKRRRVGQSIVDGVIIRDGKYECQFCHKMFTERRRYNGHVGIHVKYQDRSLEPVTDEIIMEKNVTSFRDGAASAFSEHNNSINWEKETKLIEENVSTKSIHVINDNCAHGNEHIVNIVSDHSIKCCDDEEEKIMVHETCNAGAMGEIKNSLPLRNSCYNDKERNVMQEICPLPNQQNNDGFLRNNMPIEEKKNDHIVNCFDNERNSVQEVCNAQCIGLINAGFPLINKVNKDDSFPDMNNEASGSAFTEIDDGLTDQKPRETGEAGHVMNGDTCTHLDYTCSSLSDAGNCTPDGSLRNDLSNKAPLDEMGRPSKPNIDCERNSIGMLQDGQISVEMAASSGSVIDGIENSEKKICLDSNVHTLSGMEQSNTRNTMAICMAEELVEMVKVGNEPQNDLECANTASDSANIVHGETQLSGIEERFLESSVNVPSGRKYCDMDDMLPSSGDEIMFEMMGQSSNGLKDHLMSDGNVLDVDAPRNDTGIADEGNMQSLQVNLQASWEHTSSHLPILDMISDQGSGHHQCANGNRGEISCFEDMRLEDIEPQKLVALAGRDSRQQLDDPMVATSGLGNGHCVQLDWEAAFPSLVPRSRFTTVCVWCGTEFEHDDVDIEVQPDSVGFMCPTCKAKISGQM